VSVESLESKKPSGRVMSGVRVTAPLHIGNYFGAVKNWLELQKEYTCFFGVMDWHGLTTAYKRADEIDSFTRDIYAELIAWGIDNQKHTLFVQSLVPEHLELFMIFANITPMGWLERVNTWKDAEEEAKASDTHNLGRFSYPVLQAADIAMYKGSLVPVGKDQVSHLEISREIVRRFNHLYKAKLPEPKALLTDTPTIPGTDGRKMSKSYGNVLPLIEEPKKMTKIINQLVTDPQRVHRHDPGNPDVCPVFEFHKLFSSDEDRSWVRQGCTTAGIGCGDCKARLGQNIIGLQEKPLLKKKELLSDTKLLNNLIDEGCAKARREAQLTLSEVRKAMKFYSGRP
jgi:tryptophanyl-tRNA synthetase